MVLPRFGSSALDRFGERRFAPGELIRNYLSQPEFHRLGERDPDLMTRLQQALVAAETVKTESS